ncbi:MAG TPA: RNA polymerase sigma-70 factor [Puia sp.]|jgi:RNA polymerase sigma-70 factor (ECF subfamily)|nr:RNA polymerase sigma-70 factor [Puia sp.]
MEKEHPFLGDYPLAFLQQIAAGDEGAFRQVYLSYYKRLYQFALAIMKTREPAEEIVEDVFIRIWQQREELPTIRNLRVYLYTATKNTALNYLSKKARESITEPFDHIQIELNGSAVNPEQILITAEMYKKIQKAVEALPPRCKMIFKLVREDGLRYKEIAEILNISVNTIDVQMAIAVKRIASALEAEFGFPLQKSTPHK